MICTCAFLRENTRTFYNKEREFRHSDIIGLTLVHTTLARGGTRDFQAEGITGLIPQMNEKMAQELLKKICGVWIVHIW